MKLSARVLFGLTGVLQLLLGSPLTASDCEEQFAQIQQIDSLSRLIASKSITHPQLVFDSLYKLGVYFSNDYPSDCPGNTDRDSLFEISFSHAIQVAGFFPQKIPPDSLINAYRNLGRAFVEQGRFDTAMSTFRYAWNFLSKQSIPQNRQILFLRAKADLLYEWGYTYFNYDGDLFKAQEMLENSWNTYEVYVKLIEKEEDKFSDLYYQSFVGNVLGRVYRALGNFKQSQLYYDLSLSLVQRIKSTEHGSFPMKMISYSILLQALSMKDN